MLLLKRAVMNNTQIKICGLTEVELAKQTALAGADYIGLVFHPTSKRYVTVELAKQIVTALKATSTKAVAVFTEHTATEMLAICQATGITIVQLHGSIARQQHHLLPPHYQRIYVQTVADDGNIQADNDKGYYHCQAERDFLLFDANQPGSGVAFDWQGFHYAGNYRWFLAGGLTANNVVAATTLLHPFAVDVSSGVENEQYQKDLQLVQAFISNVKGVNND
jgi:phosphoribosylanthranilate isomerase